MIYVSLVYGLLDLLLIRESSVNAGYIFLYVIGISIIMVNIYFCNLIYTMRLYSQFFVMVAMWLPVIFLGSRNHLPTNFRGSLFDYIILLISKYTDKTEFPASFGVETAIIPSLLSAFLFFTLGIYRFIYQYSKGKEIFVDDYTQISNTVVFLLLVLVGYNSWLFLYLYLISDPLMCGLPRVLGRIFKRKRPPEPRAN